MMHKLIRTLLFTPLHKGPTFTGRWGLPGAFVGAPGTGKSTVMTDMAEQYQMGLKLLSPGESGEGAFGVVPVPGEGNAILNYPPPEWAMQFERITDAGERDPAGEAGFVFLDEANTGNNPAIQSALLGLALDGRIGNHSLPGRVRRLAAMNDEQHAAGALDFAPALNNRFGWYDWQGGNADEFSSYWLAGSDKPDTITDAATEEARVLAAWNTAWSTAVGNVTSYVRNGGKLEEEPTPGKRAFATRRTIGFAMHALASAEIQSLTAEERGVLVRGFVGEAWYKGYLAHLKSMDVPNADDVLNGKIKFVHNPGKLEVTQALLTTCTSRVIGETDIDRKKARGEVMWSIVAQLMGNCRDIALEHGNALAKHRVALICKDARKCMSELELFKEKLNTAKD